MEPIPETIVEKTWQEVAALSSDRAKKEMREFANSQALRNCGKAFEKIDEGKAVVIYIFDL